MAIYHSRTHIPPLVRRALELAGSRGFENSCAIETGRLLSVLAGQVRDGKVGEIGTGCGVGAAWMLSTLPPASIFITIDRDEERSRRVRELFEPYPNAQVITGEWRDILQYGPFDLLFADTKAKWEEPEAVLSALALGGLIVLDDLTPEAAQPSEWQGKPDPVREFWLNDSRLTATEITLSSTMQIVLATRTAVDVP